jgi:hypothetical protein
VVATQSILNSPKILRTAGTSLSQTMNDPFSCANCPRTVVVTRSDDERPALRLALITAPIEDVPVEVGEAAVFMRWSETEPRRFERVACHS